MATNENVNKVIYGNQTVMDITDTTAEESDVASGEVFYKANGARSVGTLNADSAVWGQITGDIDNQSDLQTEIAKKVIRLTQAEYNALSSAEKHDTKKVYYIYDYSPAPITLINDAVISLTSTWSSQKVASELSGILTYPNMVWLCATKGQVIPENITDSSKWDLGIGITTNTDSTYLEDNTSQSSYYLSSVWNSSITWDILREGHYTSFIAVLFLKGTHIQENPKKVVIGSVPLNLILQAPLGENSREYYFWTPDFKTQLCSGGYYACGRVGLGKTSFNYSMGVKINFIGASGLFDASVDKWGVTLYAI